MAFTRDDLTAYEKQPAKEISDKVNPFRGATPAQAASAAAVAAVASGNIEATPGGAPQQQAADSDPLTDDSPVVDEDGTLGDPTDSGEGTSDDNNSEDSSASAVDPSDETDPNVDLTGDEPVKPKKGSAAERIVEVLDLAEGYKEYGKMKDAQVRELAEEVARLRGTPTGGAPTAAAPAADVDQPMPDMSDEDVSFDNDKYRAKMKAWVQGQVVQGTRAVLREVSGADSVSKVMKAVETKVETFEKDHKDFDRVVRKNTVLAQNPLGPDAGAIIAESEHTAELLYKFGKDPGLAIRVARMNPRQQVMAVTNMIRDIEDAAPKGGKKPQTGAQPGQKKSITQAPPPPAPTRGGGRAVSREPTDPNMGMEEFARQHRTGKQSAREASRKGRGL